MSQERFKVPEGQYTANTALRGLLIEAIEANGARRSGRRAELCSFRLRIIC